MKYTYHVENFPSDIEDASCLTVYRDPNLPFTQKTLDSIVGVVALLPIVLIAYALPVMYFPWATGLGGFFKFLFILLGALASVVTAVSLLLALTIIAYAGKVSFTEDLFPQLYKRESYQLYYPHNLKGLMGNLYYVTHNYQELPKDVKKVLGAFFDPDLEKLSEVDKKQTLIEILSPLEDRVAGLREAAQVGKETEAMIIRNKLITKYQ